MSQDDGLQCDYAPFNLKDSDDNAVDYLSTGNTRSPGLRKECLDKFCTYLGYRNLSYLKDLCTTSAHTGFDTTDGCFNGKGFRIIKATIMLLISARGVRRTTRANCNIPVCLSLPPTISIRALTSCAANCSNPIFRPLSTSLYAAMV